MGIPFLSLRRFFVRGLRPVALSALVVGIVRSAAVALLVALCFDAIDSAGQTPTNAPAAGPTPSKYKDFNEVVRGTEHFEGLFTLYRTNDLLYAEIKPYQ